MIGGVLPFNVGTAAYDFISADEVWKLTLTRDFVALTTGRYETWEDFKAHLQEPLAALLDLYQPAFFTRVGLRYKQESLSRPLAKAEGYAAVARLSAGDRAADARRLSNAEQLAA